MKKFLSLALALIMALSLVTISAGATEYKDLTDKDEIQYEEAVAVLNKLGIITGYEDGSFRPEGELTRGAAAKIIVSLLIGSEAAEALPATTSPYPDVPANSTFAGVISFCKNEGIIAGYNDGTFRPTGTLTGYAFSKMLLGALGFDSDVEGFTGSGWTMRVATLGNTAGLFDRISFKGGETVNRETACQLALNTLKATTVEYNGSGSTSITIAGVPVDIGGTQKWSYRTSNQDFATNIKAGDNGARNDNDRNLSDWYTVEFGEEHFVDLRLDRNKYNPIEDDFGRPCVQWSYKRVTIGKYPLDPDFSFSKQVIHALEDTSDASKLNALDMNGYKVTADTNFYVNGVTKTLKNAAAIADYTDNGAQVYAYVSYRQGQSDVLSHVVVIQSQLMEVKKIGSDYVSLQLYDNEESNDNGTPVSGYNQKAINVKVADVEVGDAYYNLLKDKKVGDLVVVEPYSSDRTGNSNTYEVGRAYAPESVTGVFSHVQTHGTNSDNRKTIALTVGGTKYSISQWNKDLNNANEDALKATKKDVTLYLDQFGYPMLAKDIGGTTDWMIIAGFRQAMQNGYLVDIVMGYDLDGEEIELNIGPAKNGSTAGFHEGDLVYYSSNTSSSNTDWVISKNSVYEVFTGKYTVNGTQQDYALSTGNSRVALEGYKNDLTADDGTTKYGIANQDGKMKFIFVSFDDDGEVSSVEILTTKQNVSNADLKVTGPSASCNHGAEACVKDDGITVKAVVIKCESSNNENLPIGQIDKYLEDITDTTKTAASVQNDGLNATNVQYANNRIIYRYTATLRNTDGTADRETDVYSYTRLNDGDYFTWSKTEHETYGDFYTLHKIGDENTQRSRTVLNAKVWGQDNGDKNELVVGDYYFTGNKVLAYPNLATQKTWTDLHSGEYANIVNISQAIITDKTRNGIESVNDLNDWYKENEGKYLDIRMLVNDRTTNDGFRYVYMMTIEGVHTGKPLGLDAPYVYDNSIATKAEVMAGAKPGVDVPENEKYTLDLPEGSYIEILVDGEKFDPKTEKLGTPGTIKVKPADGYEIKGATLDADGYYTIEVSKENNKVNLTPIGSAEEGDTVKLTGDITTLADNAKATAVVYDNAIVPTITFTAPEWAAITGTASTDLSAVNFTYKIGNNAPVTLYKTGTTAATPSDVTGAGSASSPFTITFDQIAIPEGKTADDVTIIASVTWSKVKVQYKFGGSEIAINTASVTNTATESVSTASNTTAFNVNLPTGYTGAGAKWSLSGATRPNDAALEGTFTVNTTTGNELIAASTDNPVAKGNGYVVVTFTGLTAPTDWTITASGTENQFFTEAALTGAKKSDGSAITAVTEQLTITPNVGAASSSNWTIPKTSASNVNFMVALDGTNGDALSEGVQAWNITLSFKAGTAAAQKIGSVTLDANKRSDVITGVNVPSDVNIIVTADPVTPGEIERATASNLGSNRFQFNVEFNKGVKTTEAIEHSNYVGMGTTIDQQTAIVPLDKDGNEMVSRAYPEWCYGVIITAKGLTSTRVTQIAVAVVSEMNCEDDTKMATGEVAAFALGAGNNPGSQIPDATPDSVDDANGVGGGSSEDPGDTYYYTFDDLSITGVTGTVAVKVNNQAISKDATSSKYQVAAGTTVTFEITTTAAVAATNGSGTAAKAKFVVSAAGTGTSLGINVGGALSAEADGKTYYYGTEPSSGDNSLESGAVIKVTLTVPTDDTITQNTAVTLPTITFTAGTYA